MTKKERIEKFKDSVVKNFPDILKYLLASLAGIVFIICTTYKTSSDKWTVLIAVALTFFFIVTIFLVTMWLMAYNKNKEIEEVLNKFQSEAIKSSDWYYSHKRLDYFEQTLDPQKIKEIWVVSSDLEYEKENGLFANAIKENLKKGIVYKYIIPKDPAIYGRAVNLQKGYGVVGNDKIIVKQISLEDFDYFSNIIVYQPIAIDGQTYNPNIFLELVIAEQPENRGWIKLHEYQIQNVISHIQADLDNNENAILQKITELGDQISELTKKVK